MSTSPGDTDIDALAREIAAVNLTRGKYRPFPDAIRAKVVVLASSSPLGIATLSRRLRLSDTLLNNWVGRSRPKALPSSPPAKFIPVRITDGAGRADDTACHSSGIVVRTPRGVSLSGLDARPALEAVVWLEGRLP